MAEKRPALGRGLSALIPAAAPPPPLAPTRESAPGQPAELDIDLLTPNPRQPRHANGRNSARGARTVDSQPRRHSANPCAPRRRSE